MTTASPVCPRCGWYASRFDDHDARCSPESGALADALSADVPEVPSTKLGYGGGMLTFEVPGELTVGFRVGAAHALSWEYLKCFAALSREDAADLVRTLAAWRRRVEERNTR